MNKKAFINWCRSCHFDWLTPVKEIKGKRWMSILSHIEEYGRFTIDDYSIEESLEIILKTINSMDNDKITYLHNLKYNV